MAALSLQASHMAVRMQDFMTFAIAMRLPQFAPVTILRRYKAIWVMLLHPLPWMYTVMLPIK